MRKYFQQAGSYHVIMAKKNSKLHQDAKHCFRVVLLISMEFLVKGKGTETHPVTHFASFSLC